jgi:hypothetical protein
MREQERQTGRPIKKLHCDRGTEFLNKQVHSHLQSHGILLYCSNPYSPQQNGIAEARNKTVQRIMRQLLISSSAPLFLWCFALSHATHLANLLPHRLLAGKTPAEVYTHTKPSMNRLKIWGCTGHVLLNKSELKRGGGKLSPRTKSCVYLGANPEGPGYLLWDPAKRKQMHSSDVLFQEEVLFYNPQEQGNSSSTGFTFPLFDTCSPPAGSTPEAHAGPLPVLQEQHALEQPRPVPQPEPCEEARVAPPPRRSPRLA